MIQVIVQVDSSTEDGRQIAQRIVAGEGVQVLLNVLPPPLPDIEPEQLLPPEVDRLVQLLQERGLSQRQALIVILDIQDCSRRDIAEKLNITENTIKWHWKRIYELLDVESRTEVRALVRQMR